MTEPSRILSTAVLRPAPLAAEALKKPLDTNVLTQYIDLMSTTHNFQSLVVLPSIRLARLRQSVMDITGDSVYTQEIMAAIEEHLEVDAYRWGNACPESHERVTSLSHGNWACPSHGIHSHMDPMELLIAFKPSEPSS